MPVDRGGRYEDGDKERSLTGVTGGSNEQGDLI